tara:strand:- start:594 stop:1310 length:717 start_codon:yes stop_codon:yes gene_type:complete
MARFVTGNTFGTTDTVTATTLNNAVNNAAISTDSVDGSTIELNSNALRLKDSGITTAKIADSSSKTTGVTFAKMQHISTAKVLGRSTAGEGDVEEAFDFKDEDDLGGGSSSATALASQQSIKAYVDATAVFTKSFVSSDQTFPNDKTLISLAHSLGEVPKIIQVFAKITTSTNGYASGDFILINSRDAPGTGSSSLFCTSTHIEFIKNGSLRAYHADGTTGNLTLSSSNCSLVFKAFA